MPPYHLWPFRVRCNFRVLSFIFELLMSRDPRPNRSGAGAYPPPTKRYEEYEDDYPSTSRYYNNDLPANTGRTNSQRNQGSSAASSGGSLLDRMKVKSYDQPSRTSVDNDYDSRPRQATTATWARKPGGTANRQQAPEPRREERREGIPFDRCSERHALTIIVSRTSP